MLTQLFKPRQCLLNSSSLDNACSPSRAQALASLLTLLSSGFSQLAHLIKLGLQCQFGRQVGATHSGSTSTTTQLNLGFSAGLVGEFGATHSGSTSTIIGILGSKEGQPFDAVPLLREYRPFELNRRHLTFGQCCLPRYVSPRLMVVAVASGSQKPVNLTLLTITGGVSFKGDPSLAYVATNLTIGSSVGDNTSTLSLEIPSSSMGSTSAVAGTGGILLTSNFGILARLTGGTSTLQAGTHTTKKHLKLTEYVIKSLANLV
jgi:hypothetical protein